MAVLPIIRHGATQLSAKRCRCIRPNWRKIAHRDSLSAVRIGNALDFAAYIFETTRRPLGTQVAICSGPNWLVASCSESMSRAFRSHANTRLAKSQQNRTLMPSGGGNRGHANDGDRRI